MDFLSPRFLKQKWHIHEEGGAGNGMQTSSILLSVLKKELEQQGLFTKCKACTNKLHNYIIHTHTIHLYNYSIIVYKL